MRLRDIMSEGVETVSPMESAQTALQRMRSRRIRHLVVRQGKEIVGVLSDRDLEAAGTFRQVNSVAEVMSAPAVVASPDLTPRQAANLLRGRTIGCLPVVEDDRLVGSSRPRICSI